jgi:hypothetical protein
VFAHELYIAHATSYSDNLLGGSLEKERHEEVKKVDVASDIDAEELVEAGFKFGWVFAAVV